MKTPVTDWEKRTAINSRQEDSTHTIQRTPTFWSPKEMKGGFREDHGCSISK